MTTFLRTRITLSIITCFCAAGLSQAADEVPRIDHRYSAESANGTPDFRQDIVPLIGKLGCNGRACHGSFQGQGGFRLSLFGYDFKADHENLTQGDRPRVNTAAVPESLILQKALEIVPHEGGKRFEANSWQHRVLTRWIETGANPGTPESPEFVRLEVTPNEIVASKRGETWTLKAVAIWSDGARHDVTPLCRWRTNNDQVATITDGGVVTSTGPGDSHVVVFYDNGVVPVPVMQPVSDRTGSNYPSVATNSKIDELVIDKLRKIGIVPSELSTDADFLRRVSLDMTGTLPTPREVEAFLKDDSPNKRVAKIDEMLERPTYSAWWATRFSDWTGNNTQRLNFQTSGVAPAVRSTEWYEWLRVRIERNVPYDKIAEGIILAVSRKEGEDYAQYCERMSGYYAKEPKGKITDEDSMPHYWSRRNFIQADERALGFAYSFLGLRIQCAQCHKHPFDQWTKDDFDRFKEFFPRPRYATPPAHKDERIALLEKAGIDHKTLKGNDLGKAVREHFAKGELMPFDELFLTPAKRTGGKKQAAQKLSGRTAKILGGDVVAIDEMDDPRKALMEWLRDDQNPYFAKAVVNRIWSAYFNVGIVEPVDDLSLANPPSNEALLSYLSDEFRSRGYDMKWLHRTIANSLTYQRSWKTNETNQFDERNFSHSVPRRLPAEVAYDALRIATMSDPEAAKVVTNLNGRAIADPVGGQQRRGKNDYALSIFGKSIRETNCECDRSSEASLLQTVYLQNDNDVIAMIEGKGRWVDQVMKRIPQAKEADEEIDDEPEGQAGKLAKLSTKQLRRRLDIATQKGREKAVAAIQQEIAKREAAVESESSSSTETNANLTSIVRSAFLRTLSRYPTDPETTRAIKYFEETDDMSRGLKDLLWALVNTKEFVINH
ncbi:DUF1549 and DUF1553 domain-containing protein [Schlesneria paludicola]|uniref:DUF1549 and DUF1553 domain-containing protein n=1 Tax=Schlesneria paludicola TaxID=360056 RepID=UPI00029AFC1E|nr:DUF1549 and DUF1553 domain-containing protein [Schlesneria paludicola]